MNCPVCDGVRMREVQKDDVLIDICPNCKGVWLDRGELEKITAGLKEDRKYYEETFDSYERKYREQPTYKEDYYKNKDPKYYGYKKKKKKTMFDLFEDIF
ncbi:TFIIB-type zinc ribbon-containing protein [Ornithinibacillus californiensis]|uniref:TFIIB-type zinc ribbon-containing protein n=1 Tax=Ornithinibacillus californiensis TaxID=161536 RepID=UPI00064E0FB3|nr:zf-TFIIB domain-containing protein [Ornithinibacillus californiensis]